MAQRATDDSAPALEGFLSAARLNRPVAPRLREWQQPPQDGLGLNGLVTDAPSSAVETDAPGEAPAPRTYAHVRVPVLWPSRETRGWRYALLRRMLALADVTAVLTTTLLVVTTSGESQQFLAWSLVFVPLWVVLAKLLSLYDRDQRALRHSTMDEMAYLVVWAVIGASVLALLMSFTPARHPTSAGAITLVLALSFVGGLLRTSTRRLWRVITPPDRTAIVGTGAGVRAVQSKLRLFPDAHVGTPEVRIVEGSLNPEIADTDWLRSLDRVIVAVDSIEEGAQECVRVAEEHGVAVNVALIHHGLLSVGVGLSHLGDLALLEYRDPITLSRSTMLLKRIADVVLSALGLAVLALPMALIAIAVKVDSPGPVFFRQTRIGQRGTSFRIFKFRSMVADAEDRKDALRGRNRHSNHPEGAVLFKIDDDPRITRVGAFLRRTSLDEFPQLLNVIHGDMSLVGPRPLVPEESCRIQGWASRRFDVKPGITGLWQVNGASELSFSEMVRLDHAYVGAISMRTDVELMLRTCPIIFGRRNRG